MITKPTLSLKMLSTPDSTLSANFNTTTPNISGKKLAKLRKQHLETRSRQTDTNAKLGGFRQAEKYYKTRLWEPDYSKALGHHNLPEPNEGSHLINETQIEQFIIPGPSGSQACEGPTQLLRLVTFPDRFPGLVYIPGYLTAHQQRELIIDCFETSLRPPNVNNVDAHWIMPEGTPCGLFELYRAWHSEKPEEGSDEDQKKYVLQPRAIMLPPPLPVAPPLPTKRMTVDLEPITAENYLTARNEKVKEDPIPSDTVKPIHISDLWMKGKLRWCTIGWQYHWTTKTYHFEREPTPMSQLVSSTCTKLVNEIVPWERICPTMSDNRPSWRDGYRPEAGVINFYQVSLPLARSSVSLLTKTCLVVQGFFDCTCRSFRSINRQPTCILIDRKCLRFLDRTEPRRDTISSST